VFGLRARNVDVLTAAEADMINRQDEDHLTAAAAAGERCSPTTRPITAPCINAG